MNNTDAHQVFQINITNLTLTFLTQTQNKLQIFLWLF